MSNKDFAFISILLLIATLFVLSISPKSVPLTDAEKAIIEANIQKNTVYFQYGEVSGTKTAIFKIPKDSVRPVFAIYREISRSHKGGYGIKKDCIYPEIRFQMELGDKLRELDLKRKIDKFSDL